MTAVTLDPLAIKKNGNTLCSLSRIFVALSLLAVAVMGVVLFTYAMPCWDDLIRATRPNELGFFRYVFIHVYCHWQGRWASAALESFLLPRIDITRYYFTLIVGVAAINAAGAFAICRWFTRDQPRKYSLTLTAGFLALVWAGMPSLAETVYWFVGGVENAMAIALAAMVVVALLNFRNPLQLSVTRKAIYIAVLCIAAIVISGFHELFGAMFCIALGIGTLWSFFTPSRDKIAWTAVTLAATVGVLIVAIAPGNHVRLAQESGSHGRQFIYDLKVALHQFATYAPRWLFDPKMIGAALFVCFSSKLTPRNQSWIPWRWIVPIAWAVMLALGFFAPSWAFGANMPGRTLSGIYIVFVMGWLTTVYVWSPHVRGWLPKLNAWENAITSAGLILFSISLITVGNFNIARKELRDRIQPWHAAVEKRFDHLRHAAGTDALVTVLPKWPRLLLTGEIVDDPTDYRNWSTSDFFHLRSIRIQPAIGNPIAPPLRPTKPPEKESNLSNPVEPTAGGGT